MSATSSYVVHATPKYMSFHVADRKRTVVKWAMFPFFMTLSSPRHTWRKSWAKCLPRQFPQAFPPCAAKFWWEINLAKIPNMLDIFCAARQIPCRFCWQSLHCPHYYTVFHYGTVDRSGSPFNAFIIIQSFTMALLIAVSVFIILFAISLRYRGLLCASNGSLWTGIL